MYSLKKFLMITLKTKQRHFLTEFSLKDTSSIIIFKLNKSELLFL